MLLEPPPGIDNYTAICQFLCDFVPKPQAVRGQFYGAWSLNVLIKADSAAGWWRRLG